MLRVETPSSHHYRLVLRHPDRALDPGFRRDLVQLLETLSDESEAELHRRFEAAVAEGLTPVPLRTVQETVDYWRDAFWDWLGLDRS